MGGADILAQDQLGQTPLHWAVQGGAHEACARLLNWERGAQALCLSDRLGQTPTDIARLFDKNFLYIRNQRSLLKVLAKEYTEIKIPNIGFKLRKQWIEQRAGGGTGSSGNSCAWADQSSSSPRRFPKRPPTQSFRDLDGPWKP